MMPRMSGLGTRLALALVLSAARSLLSGQSVGGRWLGGVGRVLLPSSQLPLQIGDLLFGVRDLLIGVRDLFIGVRDLFIGIRYLLFVFGNLTFAFRHFTAEFFVLAQQPLILPIQLFTAELVGVPMAIRHYLWLPCPASRSRTHPPYGNRSRAICPEKSTGVPELLRIAFASNPPGALVSIGYSNSVNAAFELKP